jgi:hypothetical protein
MIKVGIRASLLAAVAALVGFIPANAQNPFHTSPFHTRAIPWICTTVTGTASSQWVNNPNHFHLVLDVQAGGCGSSCTAATTGGLIPQVPAECIGEGGAVINGQGQKIGNFSFDFKTEYCGASASQDVFVFVTTTDGDSFFETCESFPVTGAHNVWHHEVFDLSNLSFPAGSKFDQIYLGLFNEGLAQIGEAQFRNIAVNGIASTPVTKPAETLSNCFMFFVK